MTTSTAARRSSFLGGCILPIVCCVVFISVGLAAAPRFYTWWWGLASTPQTTAQELPTAGLAPHPTRGPLPTQTDYGVAAYNATHAAQDAPVATEATPAPIGTPTTEVDDG